MSTAIACASVVPALTAALGADRRATRAAADRRVGAGTVPIAVRVDRPGRRRRGPARQRPGRGAAVRDAGGRRRPRDRDDVRLRRDRRRLRRRRDRAGPRARPRGARGRTAKLPRVELRVPDRAIGRDTVERDPVRHRPRLPGARQRAARADPRASSPTLGDVRPRDVRAILTGGLSAAPWATSLEGVDAIDPDLTLKGLAILHAEVSRRRSRSSSACRERDA